MKVGLLGMGTIGSGVFEQLAMREDISVARVLDIRKIPELGNILTSDIDVILDDPDIDVVVELMGGLEPAFSFVTAAMQRGKHVVSANKYMISRRLPQLLKCAQENNVEFRFSASVGGSIPYLYNILRARRADTICEVHGIVNGTTNLILDTMQNSDVEFADVLAEAQRLGYAEADPSSDIDGIDAGSKIAITASLAFNRHITPESVLVEGLRKITKRDIQAFKKMGRVCRYIASAEMINGSICPMLMPTLFPEGTIEAGVSKNFNMTFFTAVHSGTQGFFGQGAGKHPTAYAVLGDLIDLNENPEVLRFTADMIPANIDHSLITKRFYLRCSAEPGLPCENAGDGLWITNSIPVSDFYNMVSELRKDNPELFFASFSD